MVLFSLLLSGREAVAMAIAVPAVWTGAEVGYALQEEQKQMALKAQGYCADTMGLALDPKLLTASKEHCTQGLKDNKKSP
ncbi:MAG: hypothetical protein GWN21_06860 [Gammaproteobacteria bacterium]|nr:hypothetical protein [Gammaproteobacteria bacterium]NIR23182.1 hypothetical protein [Gammaproteobacteria bacterium]NIS04753.1 hypothetical protein [Gammaproteobacteria bacterium]NIV46906.1 hypothetical protein [Gammaproteobacteria bacterium]NIW54992.1 hypothetical protein [Gammaproteobacteria bacterium]